MDREGSVYITGYCQRDPWPSPTTIYISTIRLSPAGALTCACHYDGIDPCSGTDIAVDNSGYAYVTGYEYSSGGAQKNNIVTLKIDCNTTRWVQRYNGPASGDDHGYSIAVDVFGNVYVTGESWGGTTGRDYVTLKYSTNGVPLDTVRYDGPVHGDDVPVALRLIGNDSIVVTGASLGMATAFDIATLIYDSSFTPLDTFRYDGPPHLNDRAGGLSANEHGIYVCGSSDGGASLFDVVTIKYGLPCDTICDCSHQGDCNSDGIINPVDVVFLINYAFKGGPPPPTDASCSCLNRGDWDCDGDVDMGDIVKMVNYVYRGGPGPVDPCGH